MDLIQIHSVSQSEDLDAWERSTGVLTALRRLREQKVARFIGLPVSVAVIGVASVAPLRANVRMVLEAAPMTVAEQRELEAAMG